MEHYIGQLLPVSFNFAPKGWALCNGQLLAIDQNQALFALIGTTFGGDGRTNFALPNLQGRIPMGASTAYTLGQLGGEAAFKLTIAEVPAHSHNLMATANGGSQNSPAAHVLASAQMYNPSTSSLTALNAGSISNAGGSQAHENRQPYLVINWIIALQGIFPTRS